MTDMGDAAVCWAPECANTPSPSRGSRPSRYCGNTCRVRAFRRNGGKAPDAPYPPLEPGPLQQDAMPATVILASPEPAPHSSALVTPPEGEGAGEVRKGTPASTPRKQRSGGRATRKPTDRGNSTASPPEDTPAPATVTQLHIAVTEDSTVPVTITVHPMVAAYKADLERMGQLESRQGHQIVAMAEKLVSSATSPTAAANLSKELERLMNVLQESAPKPAGLASMDPAEVIRERTMAKLRAVKTG